MNQPNRHHYLPVFYLARWASEQDARILYYKRVPGKVVGSRRGLDHTGYEDGLYSLNTSNADNKQIIETHFMAPVIDNRAAFALKNMVDQNGRNLSSDDALAIAHFLLSLRARHPEAISYVKEKGTETLLKELQRDPEEWAKVKGEADPETFTEHFAKTFPERFKNFGLLRLPLVMTDDQLSMRVCKMNWRIVDCSSAGLDLITCDRPFHIEGQLTDGPFYGVFAVSPRILLMLATDERMNAYAMRGGLKDTVKRVNKALVQDANKLVYATSDQHRPLIEKYLRDLGL